MFNLSVFVFKKRIKDLFDNFVKVWYLSNFLLVSCESGSKQFKASLSMWEHNSCQLIQISCSNPLSQAWCRGSLVWNNHYEQRCHFSRNFLKSRNLQIKRKLQENWSSVSRQNQLIKNGEKGFELLSKFPLKTKMAIYSILQCLVRYLSTVNNAVTF